MRPKKSLLRKSKKEKTKKKKMNKTKLKRKAKGKKQDTTKVLRKVFEKVSNEDAGDVIQEILEKDALYDIQEIIVRDLYKTLKIRGDTKYQQSFEQNGPGDERYYYHLWTNLDPYDEFTANWLTKVSLYLKKSDYNDLFWWKIIENMLRHISECYENEDEVLNEDEDINYKKSKNAIIKILKRNGFEIDNINNKEQVTIALNMWLEKRS